MNFAVLFILIIAKPRCIDSSSVNCLIALERDGDILRFVHGIINEEGEEIDTILNRPIESLK
jgi:hypothetical protein